MSNRDRKKNGGSSTDPNKLSHNPFAGLRGKLELPSAEIGAPATVAPDVREPERAPPAARGRLLQRRETKRRAGKAVIVVSGFAALTHFDREAVEQLAKELKTKLGCGGTVEDEGAGLEIVIQGDQPKKVAELLRAKGFRVDGVTSAPTKT